MYLKAFEYRRIESEVMPHTPPKVPIKEPAIDFYLDWTNNYLTIEKMAADYGISPRAASVLVSVGKAFFEDSQNGEEVISSSLP